MTTTLDQARRMIEVTDRARYSHQLRHVERDKAGVVFDGVELPDADAFYVVRKRLTIPKGPGEKRETEWVVVYAAAAQADAVAWIDGDLPAEDEEAASG